jgi:hypothetical protein
MIGFLLPKLAWLALFALGPVVIHLLNRIRLRRVEFSSLQFLREVKRERFNWLRLKEILLLIARTAVLLFLFLGLSRPFLKSGLFGVKREVSAVLILDDSYSMRYGSASDRMMQEAKTYLSQLTGTSEAAILTSSQASHLDPLSLKPLSSLFPATALSRDIRHLISAVDSTGVSYTGADLASAVEQAKEMLADATLPQREIVIFTDLQKRAVNPIPAGTDKRINVLVRDCGTADWQNCAVTEASDRERLVQPGKPVNLSAKVRNFGSTAQTRTVTLKIDGATESRNVSIPPGDEKTVDFEKQVLEPGQHAGQVSIDHDSLTVDDERAFVVTIPDRLPVLLVGDAPDDIAYLSRALAPESTGFFEVATRLSANLRTADLRRFRVVGLINTASLTGFDWQRVEDYVRQGGSVFIALGREPREKTFLSQFVSYQAEMKPAGFVTMDKVDYTHPILEAFQGRADVSVPRFFRYAHIEPAHANVLARLSDGSPYIVESRQDRVIIASSDLRLEDNDLAFKALFVPLMHRIFSYLGQEQTSRRYVVGDVITVSAPTIGLLKVKTPEAEYNLTPGVGTTDSGPRVPFISFRGTEIPGIYQFGNNLCAVNLLNDEGELTRVSEPDLAKKNLILMKDAQGKKSDLTNLLLMLSALFLIAEMLIIVL